MAAANYHPGILIPKYGQKDSVKPLTANPRIAFCGKIIWPSFGRKVSNVWGKLFFFPLKFDNCYANQNTHQNIKAKSNDHLIEKKLYLYIYKNTAELHRNRFTTSFYDLIISV